MKWNKMERNDTKWNGIRERFDYYFILIISIKQKPTP